MTPGNLRRRSALTLLGLLLALGLGSCGSHESAGPERGATVEAIRERDLYDDGIDRYVGQTVTVSAEVAGIVTPSAFEIAGEGGPDPILVITRPATATRITDDSMVKITGQVRELAIAEAERDLGVDLNDAALATYVDDHVIFAEKVEILSKDG